MIWFFIFAGMLALGTTWLLLLPTFSTTDMNRYDKIRTASVVLVLTILFPFTVYCLVTF